MIPHLIKLMANHQFITIDMDGKELKATLKRTCELPESMFDWILRQPTHQILSM